MGTPSDESLIWIEYLSLIDSDLYHSLSQFPSIVRVDDILDENNFRQVTLLHNHESYSLLFRHESFFTILAIVLFVDKEDGYEIVPDSIRNYKHTRRVVLRYQEPGVVHAMRGETKILCETANVDWLMEWKKSKFPNIPDDFFFPLLECLAFGEESFFYGYGLTSLVFNHIQLVLLNERHRQAENKAKRLRRYDVYDHELLNMLMLNNHGEFCKELIDRGHSWTC